MSILTVLLKNEATSPHNHEVNNLHVVTSVGDKKPQCFNCEQFLCMKHENINKRSFSLEAVYVLCHSSSSLKHRLNPKLRA